jgi:hypothetical protein
MVEVAMRPRLSPLGLALIAHSVIIWAIAPAAWAQSSVVNNIPAVWSTDPSCSAQALRVTFGGNALAMERNGHVIFRGPATLAISDSEIAVRLGTDPLRADSERNVIRFSRAGEALRLVSLSLPGANAQHPRVPPLYPCRAPGVEAAGSAVLPASATLPASAR